MTGRRSNCINKLSRLDPSFFLFQNNDRAKNVQVPTSSAAFGACASGDWHHHECHRGPTILLLDDNLPHQLKLLPEHGSHM